MAVLNKLQDKDFLSGFDSWKQFWYSWLAKRRELESGKRIQSN
jgi:hypothetical protein